MRIPVKSLTNGIVGVFCCLLWTLPAADAAAPAPKPPNSTAEKPAAIRVKLARSPELAIRMFSPDGKRYLLNKQDNKGIDQVYVGTAGKDDLVCITDQEVKGAPKAGRRKMQPCWHPSGKWIFMAVEREVYTPPPILGANKDFVEGELQCGLWTDMWAVSPDGKKWHRQTTFQTGKPGVADGYTGPAFTPDGKTAVWSQIVSGNIFAYYPFGRWELTQAEFVEVDGVPTLKNRKDITPQGMHWNEPGNFSPDGKTLVLSGSTEKDAQGQDQYLLDIQTGKLTNLTNSPTVWDEHGVFSPDGETIVFMSAYPYREDPNASKILGIKTEFMAMRKDGSGLSQLTHFCDPHHADHTKDFGIAAVGYWQPDGHSLRLICLRFPKYVYWDLDLKIESRVK